MKDFNITIYNYNSNINITIKLFIINWTVRINQQANMVWKEISPIENNVSLFGGFPRDPSFLAILGVVVLFSFCCEHWKDFFQVFGIRAEVNYDVSSVVLQALNDNISTEIPKNGLGKLSGGCKPGINCCKGNAVAITSKWFHYWHFWSWLFWRICVKVSSPFRLFMKRCSFATV